VAVAGRHAWTAVGLILAAVAPTVLAFLFSVVRVLFAIVERFMAAGARRTAQDR